MIGQSKAKQSDVEQINLLLDKILSNAIELSEVDEETSLLADLSQEDTAPQKEKKSGQLFRWAIFSLLGFGLVAIGATAFLGVSSSCKNKSPEGRTYLGAIGKTQQAFWLENRAFGRSIPALAIGISEETESYKYDIQSFEHVAYHYGVPKNDNLVSYVGAVFVIPETDQTSQGLTQQTNQTSSTKTISKTISKKDLTTVTILCASSKIGVKQKLANPFLQNGTPTCAEGTVAFN
ncbi:MAG: type IV pilin-like G/H family protein [Pseudanabaena sp.]|jgi:hypothetical protein